MTRKKYYRGELRWGPSIPWYQIALLEHLERRPGICGVDLQETFDTHGIYVLIHRLEKRGLIRRVAEQHGAQVYKFIFLTESGEQFLAGMRLAGVLPAKRTKGRKP